MSDIPTVDAVEQALVGLAVDPPAELASRILAATDTVDRAAVISGPLGPLTIVFNDRGVVACVPTEHWHEHLEQLEHQGGRRVVDADDLPPRLGAGLRRALDSGRLGRLPVDLQALTPFQQAVLRKTAEIPPGEVRPYGWIAREIGRPGAVRAVGSALSRNPIPVLIPCHRVSRSDGTIGRYAYGPEMKRDLLRHEGLDPDEVEDMAARNVRFVGSANGDEYCFPTCRHVREIRPDNRIEFASVQSAMDAGYHPCSVCRPAA